MTDIENNMLARMDAAEIAVLGAILLETETMGRVVPILSHPGVFATEQHQVIFTACLKLWDQGSGINLLTVKYMLEKWGRLKVAGGAYYLTGLASTVASSHNVERHAQMIYEAFMRRQTLLAGRKITGWAEAEHIDPFELVEESTKLLSELTGSLTRQRPKALADLASEFMTDAADAQAAFRAGTKISGIPVGIEPVDGILRGLKGGKLYLIAGRPGMGKSALGCAHIPIVAATMGTPVLICNLEMANRESMGRLVAHRSGIPASNVENGEISDSQMEALDFAVDQVNRLPIFLEDSPHTVGSLKALARAQHKRNKIGMLVVDYIQLVRGTGREKRDIITDTANELKALAKELDIPVVAMAQLNRDLEKRGVHRAMLSDLAESGGLEQAADCVISMYRPAYYGKQYCAVAHSDFVNALGDSADHIFDHLCCIDVLKQRGGLTGIAWCYFHGGLSRFEPVPWEVARDLNLGQTKTINSYTINNDEYGDDTPF